jgi:tetratricopeptide (TPR) repeat protein
VGKEAGQLSFSADGHWLAVARSNGVTMLDSRSFAPATELSGAAGMRTVAVSSNGQWVAAGNWVRGEVWVWDVASSNQVTLPVGGAAQVAFSADDKWLATTTTREGRLWRTGLWNSEVQIPLPSVGNRPAPTALSRDGTLWAVFQGDGRIALFRSATLLARLDAPHRDTLVDLRFSPDSTRLIAAEESKSIQVWDLATLRHGLAELRLDWPGEPLVRRFPAPATPLTVSNAVGWFVNRAQLAEATHRQNVVMITEEMERLGRTRERLCRRATEESTLGLYADAIADWKESLGMEPTNTAVLRDLAWCYLHAPAEFRDYAAARDLAAQAVALEPRRVENLLRLGMACYRTGDYTNALVHLRLAAERRRDGKTAFSRFYEAMCHARMNQPEDARTAYAKGIESTDLDSGGASALLPALRGEATQLLEEMQ